MFHDVTLAADETNT